MVTQQEATRSFGTRTTARDTAQSCPVFYSKEELNGLIEQYDTHLDSISQVQGKARNRVQDVEVRGDDYVLDDRHSSRIRPPPRTQEDIETILRIEKLLEDERSSHEELYGLYQSLPFPKISCLPRKTIRALLHHLAVVEKRDETSMLRYLSIVDDLKAANIPLISSEWNSAIAFAGKSFSKMTESEVQSAMYIFKEMESKAGVEASFCTFNILFDIATRAGRYSLAEAFIQEMERRDIAFTRHFKTSRIYYYGCRRNGDGVRSAYKDLVDSGHVVDTVVLNCVIASLIRANEPVAAEHVFLRMKYLHAEKQLEYSPADDWRKKKKLGKAMSYAHLNKDRDASILEEFHKTAPVVPDMTTYRLLVGHHANDTGNLDRVVELLEEMKEVGLPYDGAIFFHLFRGYGSFGGVPYTAWTLDRLESTWTAFKEAAERDPEKVAFKLGVAIVSLTAFGKCAGPRRVIEAWEEMQSYWNPTDEEEDVILDAMRNLIPQDSDVLSDK